MLMTRYLKARRWLELLKDASSLVQFITCGKSGRNIPGGLNQKKIKCSTFTIEDGR